MMQENMLNVLMYLFKNHMQNDCRLNSSPRKLTTELQQMGFKKESINGAFNWLAELSVLQFNIKQSPLHKNSLRIFSFDECKKINKECRGFITYLQKIGILNAGTREIIVSQIMQLDNNIPITLNIIKWVTLMVLFSQPEERDALISMQYLVLNDSLETMH